jgi:pyruvate formate lyase activating enzyme
MSTNRQESQEHADAGIYGTINNVQRLSTEDGPGIRTTVFFKGCPLACSWCHNPESISPHLQIQWYATRCLACRTCLDTCENGALSLDGDRLTIDRSRCQACGRCAEACPANALETLGKKVCAPELVDELLKDRAFFEKSGGGVTLSGGEPLMQASFSLAILQGLKAAGIHTALDTCGLAARQTFERLLPFTDMILYDLKMLDDDLHLKHTAQSNRLILANLIWLNEVIRTKDLPVTLWIRTPLIPGATIHPDNLLEIGKFIQANLNGAVERWELCAFNNLCRDKYERLDMHWDFTNASLLTASELAACENAARACGLSPEIVMATGSVKTV